MKLISWNVNGIRAIWKKGNGFLAFLKNYNPDVVCLQETKARREQLTFDYTNVSGYRAYFSSSKRLGYSGVAIYSKVEPLNVTYGIGQEGNDDEGRVVTVEYEKFYLVNVYTPNSKRGLSRLKYRTEVWDPAFLRYIKGLDKKKPVIFCGDLNCAHTELDIARPKANLKSAGFTVEERQELDKVVAAGFIDTFRIFFKDGGHYTWWSYFSRARERNIGWRIDYFFVSKRFKRYIKSAGILPEVEGSDHCPVVLEVNMGLHNVNTVIW